MTFIELVNAAKVEIKDSFKKGIISKMELDKESLSLKMFLLFPSVLPLNDLKGLIEGLASYIKATFGVKEVTFDLRYESTKVTPDTVREYYQYFLGNLKREKVRYTVLDAVQTEYAENSVELIVADVDEKKEISNLAKPIMSSFELYGIYVTFVTTISSFATPLKSFMDAYNNQTYAEMVKEQAQYDRSGSDNNEDVKKEKKFRYSPKQTRAINKAPTPLADLPSSQADLIIYNQKFGGSEVAITGIIDSANIRPITSKKDGQTYQIFEGVLRDKGSFITLKTFINLRIDHELERFQKNFVAGAKVRCGGTVTYDKYSRDIVFQIQDITLDDTVEDEVKVVIEDNAPEKRVELHAHSKMSVQDGVMEVEDYVAQAARFGHKACAITDFHNIQALPDFYNACIKEKIKPIFGLEGELVDEDKYKIALCETDENNSIDLRNATYVVYDLETTGLSSNYNEIIEIAAAKIQGGMIIDEFSTFVKPKREIGEQITELTSITNDDVRNAESVEVLLPKFYEFFKGSILVAHNATFDNSHLYQGLEKLGIDAYNTPSIDTMQLAKVRYGHGTKLKKFNLKALCLFFDVELLQHHRAINDAKATALCFIKMLNDLLDSGIHTYGDINKMIDDEAITDLAYPTHFTVLSCNEKGKKNLYELVSDSHTVHFYKSPLIVKSFLEKHRDGLLIGSGCIDGDVFLTAYEKPYKDLLKVMELYDFIEVQPVSVCSVLKEKFQDNKVTEFIKETIKTIIKAAKELGKIVVATGNVHELTEEDLIVRKIYIDAPQIGGGVHPLKEILPNVPSMHFMTTNEMLEEFSFLGKDLAYEIVVTNTNKIADMVSEYPLFPKDLLVPHDDMLKDKGVPSFARGAEELTYSNAKKIYGDPLPQIIKDRIDKELEVIVGKGYASIYYLSHLLVKYSTDAGYVVGSRGSVGSSLVAYFMNITEVNALPPHYYCPHCHFMAMKLNSEEKKLYPITEDQAKLMDKLDVAGTGYDLPVERCPVCGEILNRNGVDIPFETFLGTKTETKVPDIDLNFSGEFQAKAHEFCRTMFDEDHAFRAGTIQTVAENTAYGYVKKYFERLGKEVRTAEIDNLVKKVQGGKRTTSKHPGGIVVFPLDVNYTDVIPVQYPSDDITGEWRTTHFDYHKFEHNLLKFDILGHDDPTMVRCLMNYVEKYPDMFDFKTVEDIPITDPDVFRIFNSVEPLGVTSADLNGEVIGTTGIPEFGTNLAKDMLIDAKPQTYADLLKISGLSHGTDVWQGNARDFLLGKKEGFDKVPFSELIGCRDDIMVYLISKGLPAGDAFAIMEKVRKGKGVSPDFEKEMLEHNVPKWYIESCKLIKYMFPKAHATAYVIMALRIAYFKVKKPLFYYAAFLSKRAKAFDVQTMILGPDSIRHKINELKDLIDRKEATAKDEDILKCLKVVLEACVRGIKFKMIDINKSDARDFIEDVESQTLLMPINALDSLGEATADNIVEERNIKPFSSKRDLLNRTKLNKSQFERLEELGALDDLPDEDDSKLDLGI